MEAWSELANQMRVQWFVKWIKPVCNAIRVTTRRTGSKNERTSAPNNYSETKAVRASQLAFYLFYRASNKPKINSTFRSRHSRLCYYVILCVSVCFARPTQNNYVQVQINPIVPKRIINEMYLSISFGLPQRQIILLPFSNLIYQCFCRIVRQLVLFDNMQSVWRIGQYINKISI